ncbi:hypothetical protein FJV41_05525 [Myxococcus llanfairpwllgwyngyllgogerychwyrndrobwllllantysiliogogogochensis]|uniref:Uncharacterized protein n=1 Tax=Myxococcus llanfairpwllgwyngyllgogerychwyrndrobwllllantysiliogogogochensis TaxID=2590453 RepID=A0A540X6V1_9BACT|nr:hypothetical protein [Myxococcus llanfairpwllgwyngyllgogerychwyrndrobwllllantysiliogogogochensis]TQF17003.1 hypothetical protein FJV41_05525 [Myxococcus llanfairpwllgwyngyllgogerychwyrndrobwllllantysiliogogogochensis]
MPGSGSETLRTVLLALGVSLVLATVFRAEAAECPTVWASERSFYLDSGATSVRQGSKSSKGPSRRWGAQFHVTDLGGWDSGLHVGSGLAFTPPSSARGRASFEPDLQALHRWGRERRHAVARVTLRERRSAAAPTSSGDIADRPSIVTRPLRGPPRGR